ncbi:MAG TPA: hypothetical protein VMZ06_12930 [Candidatus Bathyarchaeia archaeon]|nr:hypothetical protein [Candidatus Bathyarchaeia archaeon]
MTSSTGKSAREKTHSNLAEQYPGDVARIEKLHEQWMRDLDR